MPLDLSRQMSARAWYVAHNSQPTFDTAKQDLVPESYEGQNSLRKMCIDLRFLPLPVEQVTVV